MDSSCIVATLLATNVWNLLDSLRMYCKTTVESVQQIVSCIGYSNLFQIRQFNFTSGYGGAFIPVTLLVEGPQRYKEFVLKRIRFTLPECENVEDMLVECLK